MKYLFLLLTIFTFSCTSYKNNQYYKYRIERPGGYKGSNTCDYTNEYRVNDRGCIEYIDNHDKFAIVCGTYTIVNLR